MNRTLPGSFASFPRLRGWACLLIFLLPGEAARAQPPVAVQVEVGFLLGFLAGSDCEFFRNGNWYAPPAAQAHLRSKYRYLVARDLVRSTEDFIDKAASRSEMSGLPYQVRCRGGAAVDSNRWLRAELARLRALD